MPWGSGVWSQLPLGFGRSGVCCVFRNLPAAPAVSWLRCRAWGDTKSEFIAALRATTWGSWCAGALRLQKCSGNPDAWVSGFKNPLLEDGGGATRSW